jgi:HEPN domain-containing protein
VTAQIRYHELRDLLLELLEHPNLEIRDSARRVLIELENRMLPTKWGRSALVDLLEALVNHIR